MGRPLVSKSVFDEPSIWKILARIAPPVMLAQLIQAMYNIVDSFFVGRFSGDGLTALSVIYPVQLIVIAVAVGTGVGVNTQMSQDYARGRYTKADRCAGAGTMLAVLSWLMFVPITILFLKPYVLVSASSPQAVEYALTYGYIVCIGSLGVFLEGVWSKVHQASGNMKRPMAAQVAGALTNIVLDPVLIFGLGPVPELGVAGAAAATVVGQVVAALIVCNGFRKPPKLRALKAYAARIYHLGYPSIFMQMLYTVYIVALNLVLAGFSDSAVTVLGLYYKLQSFFFIPAFGLQTCIVPLLSYTYAKQDYDRCKKVLWDVMLLSAGFMLVAIAAFELIPAQLLSLFGGDKEVVAIGVPAFRIIGLSFLPAVASLTMPIFFQAIGKAKPSVLLSLTRQIFCLIPIFWGFSKLGLNYTWLAFPCSEIITGTVGFYLYGKQTKRWKLYHPTKTAADAAERSTNMKLITAIINTKDTNEVCQALAQGGFYFTKMATSGGFLSSGNTTLLIGTEGEKVSDAVAIIKAHCSKRVEPVQLATRAAAATNLTEVVVGGATVFVTEVEHFEKM